MARHSLRTYLASFAVILTVATVAVLASVTEEAATRQLEQNIGGNLALRAREVADKLDRGMYERRQDIELEAGTLSDAALRQRPVLVRKRLDALVDAYGGYAWIGYAGVDGKVLASAKGLLEGEDVSQRPWFGGAIGAAFIGDAHRAVLLEKHLNPSNGEPLRFLDVAMPVLDSDGSFAGVLGAHIDWRWIRETATSARDDGQHTETLILSTTDRVLLGPNGLQDRTLDLDGARQARLGAEGYRIERWPDGKMYLTGYSVSKGHLKYPGLGWIIIVREQLDQAYAPVRELRQQFLVVGTVIALLVAAFGWLMAMHISRPLITIANAAQSLQQRDRNIAFPINNSFREVAVLSRSLSSLLGALTQREAQLEHQAKYQNVTELPNRTSFTALLAQAIDGGEDKQLAILTFCLDRFNSVTDALDLGAGNTALLEMVERVKKHLDASCVLAHLDKEEFAFLFPGRDTVLSRAMGLASLLQQALAKPISIRGFDFFLSGSFGISIYPKDGLQAETLLRHSEAALQQARMRGGNRIEVYEPEAHARILERLSLERDLRHAIEREQFELHYQPQFSFARNAIVGVEALIRWRHPERGWISPAVFIPAAEACGLIEPIGDWVLDRACEQAQAWRRQGMPYLTISVNVSAQQFMSGRLVQKVRSALAACEIDPRQLKIEITESMMMQDVELGIAVMKQLVEVGVKVSLDDFGTGYSSLSNLKRFPLSELKIDQAFVRELTPRSQDAAIINSIISVGHNLGLGVIAEGVETEEQLELLFRAGCNAIQGYHIGKPMSADDLAARLRVQA
jgi:diguanylate cyclase (GGDEF)-like protein